MSSLPAGQVLGQTELSKNNPKSRQLITVNQREAVMPCSFGHPAPDYGLFPYAV